MRSVKLLDAQAAINRLRFVYPLPRDVTVGEAATAWAEVLGDLSVDDLDAAVTAYLKNGGRHFPKPAEIRRLAAANRANQTNGGQPSDLRSRYLCWEQTNDGPCPVCGAVLQLVTDPFAHRAVWDADRGMMRKRTSDDPPPPKRYGILHDGPRHAAAGVPAVGYRT